MTSAGSGVLRCVLASEKAGNSLDREALVSTTAALRAIRDGEPDEALRARAVLLASDGASFCTGGDVKGFHSAADRLAAGPAGTLARIKRLVWDAAGRDLPGHLPHEARSIGECAASPDGIEGVNAFAARRAAAY